MDKIKNIQLILCDLDGTLLHEDKGCDLQIIHLSKSKNIPFTFVSGRTNKLLKNLTSLYGLELPYITNNGANIFWKDKCIYEVCIELLEVKIILKILRKYGISFLAYANEKVFCEGSELRLLKFKKRIEEKCRIIYDFQDEELEKENIYKIVIVQTENNIFDYACEEINQNCVNSSCVQSEDYVYTINHIKASKGEAVKWLLRLLKVDKKKVVAFGDNYNDISMFKQVGIGVAMGNSVELVKRNANFVTKSNEENGVSWFIKKYIE